MRDQELDCFCFSLTFPSQLIDQVLITRQVVFKDGNREQMDCNHRATIGLPYSRAKKGFNNYFYPARQKLQSNESC